MTPDIIHALWSLKEDATHAWKLAISGDESGIAAVGRAMKNLETQITRADVIQTMARDRAVTGVSS